jgi:hypothetical protein
VPVPRDRRRRVCGACLAMLSVCLSGVLGMEKDRVWRQAMQRMRRVMAASGESIEEHRGGESRSKVASVDLDGRAARVAGERREWLASGESGWRAARVAPLCSSRVHVCSASRRE